MVEAMQSIPSHITTEDEILRLLKEVNDPEIPVLSIYDLGILRQISFQNDKWQIIITPTYSGCPAMDVIAMQIKMKMIQNGITNFEVISKLSPAWTTDWMTEEGKEQLRSYGIAPPQKQSVPEELRVIECPLCHSSNTVQLSEFGSTSCKSLYQCRDCKEPFDHFKCH